MRSARFGAIMGTHDMVPERFGRTAGADMKANTAGRQVGCGGCTVGVWRSKRLFSLITLLAVARGWRWHSGRPAIGHAVGLLIWLAGFRRQIR